MAGEADVEAVAGLWELMAGQHREYDPEVWCWSQDAPFHWAQWYTGLLGREEYVLPLAVTPEGRIVGFAISVVKDNPSIFAIERAGEVWDLLVHPDVRGQGVGQALMEWSFAELQRLGAQDVKLHVALANQAAVKLYEKLGMRPVMYRMYKRF